MQITKVYFPFSIYFLHTNLFYYLKSNQTTPAQLNQTTLAQPDSIALAQVQYETPTKRWKRAQFSQLFYKLRIPNLNVIIIIIIIIIIMSGNAKAFEILIIVCQRSILLNVPCQCMLVLDA